MLAKPRANLRQGRHRGLSTGRHWPADGDSDPIFLKNWARFPFLAKTGFDPKWFGGVFLVPFFGVFFRGVLGAQRGAQREPKWSQDEKKMVPRGIQGPIPKRVPENDVFLCFLGGPGSLKIELSSRQELNFHFFMGF